MSLKSTNSRIEGLSEEDLASLAAARTSDGWQVIYQTSTSPIIDYGLRRKDDGQVPTEQSLQTSPKSDQTCPSDYYSNVTTPFQNHLKQSTATMPAKMGTSSPSVNESPTSGSLPWESPFQTHGLLPTDSKSRKKIPLWSGLVKYFPDALVAVASVSQAGNDQHNPGKPLHWDRSKSMDQEDTLLRHLFESGSVDTDGHRHSAKVAWRALAMLQLEIEKHRHANG